MRCPWCGAEVPALAAKCPHCEVLVRWTGGEAEFEMPGELVEVYRALDPMILPVIESLLETNGVPYVVANEVTQDLIGVGRLSAGYNNTFGPPVVKVPESRAAEARELIASAGPPPDLEAPPGE